MTWSTCPRSTSRMSLSSVDRQPSGSASGSVPVELMAGASSTKATSNVDANQSRSRWYLRDSAALMAGVIWPYRLLSGIGVRVHESLPLFIYARYPFRILYNDQFDRFSAPLEQRFDRDEVARMLELSGLHSVSVHPSFGWIGEGTRW